MRTRPGWILLLLLGWAGPVAADAPAPLPAGPQVVLTESLEVTAGTYARPDAENQGAIVIETDGVVLDLGGAKLIGFEPRSSAHRAFDTYIGTGIVVRGAKDVVIKNGAIFGYKVAIRAENAPGLKLLGVDASGNYRQRLKSTRAREDGSDWLWPHENEQGEWTERYGAGFSLARCEGAQVVGCTVRNGQNGLLLTRCVQVDVYDNDFSFNSGWGIGMYRCTQCRIAHNRCDWCVRGYSHGVYHRGQDSAGILVFEQCRDNLFLRNSATHSGDGFFLYAGHETTKRTGLGGSGGNVVAHNDFRFAVANGIEATFSKGNVFYKNDCSGCDHGVWAGYSRHTLIAGNTIQDCLTAGISIEHGHHNRIVGNRIEGAHSGIDLWWDADKEFLEGPFGKHQDTSSSNNQVEGNEISGARVALRLWTDQATTVRGNRLGATETILELGPETRLAALESNLFQGAHGPRHETLPKLVKNRTGAPFVLPGENLVAGRFTPIPPRRGPSGVTRGVGAPAFQNVALPRVDLPACPGTQDTTLPADVPVGRERIRLGAWGPSDPRIEIVDDDRSPRVADALAGATWDVRFFEWTADPREDPEGFAKLLEGEAKAHLRVPALDFPWQSGHPEGVRADRFATLATTSFRLDAGRYRIRTRSDDGIRVYVDGKRVIDNWTHHAPTEDTALVELSAGGHSFRVEHFELDGWAWLRFELEPAK